MVQKFIRSTQLICEKILFLRKAFNKTQKEIAWHLDVDPSEYGKFERGERTIPAKHLAHLASLYGVSVIQLEKMVAIEILYKFAASKGGLLNSTQLNSTQLNSTQLNSTQLNSKKIENPVVVFFNSFESFI